MQLQQTGTVHPLVQHIKEENEYTWQAFADLLIERLAKCDLMVSLSGTNVRNFASGKSSAWWFWSEIGGIGLELWKEKRKAVDNLTERKDVDVYYAKLYSEHLAELYIYFYKRNEIEEEVQKSVKVKELVASSDVIVNILINSIEDFFKVEFPSV